MSFRERDIKDFILGCVVGFVLCALIMVSISAHRQGKVKEVKEKEEPSSASIEIKIERDNERTMDFQKRLIQQKWKWDNCPNDVCKDDVAKAVVNIRNKFNDLIERKELARYHSFMNECRIRYLNLEYRGTIK